MTDEKRIVRYLDNDLTDSERNKFEVDLSTDVSLKKLFVEFCELNDLLIRSKVPVTVEADYFKDLVSRFRIKKVDSHKPLLVRKASFVFSVILMLIVGYFLFLSGLTDKQISDRFISELSEDLDYTEFEEILLYANGDGEQDDIANIYFQMELSNLDALVSHISESESELVYEFEINDLYSGISSSEAEYIYADLVNKKF